MPLCCGEHDLQDWAERIANSLQGRGRRSFSEQGLAGSSLQNSLKQVAQIDCLRIRGVSKQGTYVENLLNGFQC